MAKNVKLLGEIFSNTPAIEVPIDVGGTAMFYDVSDTTAQENDVADGKYFYTSGGVRTMGRATGGGGESPSVTPKAVNFYDVTGRVCYAYTLQEFASLTVMPPFPTHSWLTGNGWNMTLEQAQGIAAGAGGLAVTGSWRTTDGKVDIMHNRVISGVYDLYNHNGRGVEWGNNYYTPSADNFGYYTQYGASDVNSTLDGQPAMRIYRTGTSTYSHGFYVRTAELVMVPTEARSLHFIVANDQPYGSSAMNYCVGLLPQNASTPYRSGNILLDAYANGYSSSVTDIEIDVSSFSGQQKYVVANAWATNSNYGRNFYIKSVYFE